MNYQVIIQVLSFFGVFISAVCMLLFNSPNQPSRWIMALLIFLVIGTGTIAYNAIRTRKLLTGIVAGGAVLLAIVAFFLFVTKYP